MARQRQKVCDRCVQPASCLYRVQYDGSGQWIFVCLNCWQTVCQDNPFYTYGGTWKAKKRT
jgi:hypothetical protein